MKLLNFPNVCSINDLQELRFLYDRVEIQAQSLESAEKFFIKTASENSDSKEPYSVLNLFSSSKHNSHSKQEKPHEKSSKKKFSHDKQEHLSNDKHEFVKNMCNFCRRNHKTKFCDTIAQVTLIDS